MGIIVNNVKKAFEFISDEKFKELIKDTNFEKFVYALADVADHNIRYAHHRDCLDRAIAEELHPEKYVKDKKGKVKEDALLG